MQKQSILFLFFLFFGLSIICASDKYVYKIIIKDKIKSSDAGAAAWIHFFSKAIYQVSNNEDNSISIVCTKQLNMEIFSGKLIKAGVQFISIEPVKDDLLLERIEKMSPDELKSYKHQMDINAEIVIKNFNTTN